LSYAQPDVSTKVILASCDYDALYIFWCLSFGKRFLTPSFETRKKSPELLEDGHRKILRNVSIYLQSTHCHFWEAWSL